MTKSKLLVCEDCEEAKYVKKDILIEKVQIDIGDDEKETRRGDSLFLYISAFTANIIFLAGGSNVVWTSPVLSKLTSNDAAINPLGVAATPLQVSLIAGLPFLGSVLGPLCLGKVSDTLGRKRTLLILAVTMFIAYCTLAFAGNIPLYYISRLILGVCHGTAMTVLPIFITEITEKHNRGRVGCFMGVFQVTGSLYGFALGPFFSVRTFTLLCAAPLIICIISLILIVPESPYFLVRKEKKYLAKTALEKLRNKIDVTNDLYEIELTVKLDRDATKGDWLMLFKQPHYRKAFLISLLLNLLQVLSGTTAVLAFVGPIFDSAGTKLSGNIIAILVGAVKVTTYFITSTIVEKSGRKILLLISSIGCCLPHMCLGSYFYLLEKNVKFENDYIYWLPIICVILYIINYSLGYGPIPAVFTSEVLPSNYKSGAMSLITALSCAAAFSVTSLFPLMVEYIGIKWCFWTFGGCCMSGSFLIYFLVPETKGKSLLEIQEMLRNIL